MQNHFIFAKSAKGTDRVATHPHRLPARYRRFLALVDGQRTVAELATVARPNELLETLEYLIHNGFIEKIGEAPEAENLLFDDDPFSVVALTPEMFEEFKSRAVAQLRERLSSGASNAARIIQEATTPAELRAALRSVESEVGNAGGAVTADEVRQLFLRIGRNFI